MSGQTRPKVKVMLPVGWEATSRRSEIDERYARSAYVEYCAQGHGGQSFDRLHERGGFGVDEIMLLLCRRIQRLERGEGGKSRTRDALEAERRAWEGQS